MVVIFSAFFEINFAGCGFGELSGNDSFYTSISIWNKKASQPVILNISSFHHFQVTVKHV